MYWLNNYSNLQKLCKCGVTKKISSLMESKFNLEKIKVENMNLLAFKNDLLKDFSICIENIFYIFSIYIHSIYIIYTPPSFHPERGTALYCNWLYSVYNPSILRIYSPYILHLCPYPPPSLWERGMKGAHCKAYNIYQFWSIQYLIQLY